MVVLLAKTPVNKSLSFCPYLSIRRVSLCFAYSLARPRLRPARGIRRLDCADRSAAGFSGLANGGTELLLMGKSHGTISVPRLLFHWRAPANVTPFKI